MAVTAVAATAVGLTPVPAIADPPPNAISAAGAQVQNLLHQAEALSQSVDQAQANYNAKQAQVGQFQAQAAKDQQTLQQAQATEEQFRSKVDTLTNASYEGARLNGLSALLVSKSPSSYLDASSALTALARENDDVVTSMSNAVNQAQTAERNAQQAQAAAASAAAAAGALENQLKQQSAALQSQLATAKSRYDQLSGADKAALNGQPLTDYQATDIGSGPAAVAVRAALSKQGSPYVWGATGPNDFDCSGLIEWAYQQAGIEIGRSTYTQVDHGTPVSQDDLQPGDVIFYYADNSHVAMYVGDGLAVQAPYTGSTVDVMGYKVIGSIYAIRRMAN
jgi:cell wall-associated NlpC family hydrolase